MCLCVSFTRFAAKDEHYLWTAINFEVLIAVIPLETTNLTDV